MYPSGLYSRVNLSGLYSRVNLSGLSLGWVSLRFIPRVGIPQVYTSQLFSSGFISPGYIPGNACNPATESTSAQGRLFLTQKVIPASLVDSYSRLCHCCAHTRLLAHVPSLMSTFRIPGTYGKCPTVISRKGEPWGMRQVNLSQNKPGTLGDSAGNST